MKEPPDIMYYIHIYILFNIYIYIHTITMTMTKGCDSQGIQEAAVSEAFLVHEGAHSVIPSAGKFNYGRGIVCPCPC